MQAEEDIQHLAATVPASHVWTKPGGAASIGFHILHLGGALDRLFTYARGEALNDVQKAALRAESTAETSGATIEQVAAHTSTMIAQAMAQLRRTSPATLTEPRKVGRTASSTVIGLLFHAAEHSTRHAGQAISTARILGGSA
jgi:uncharacterized damage-inducible protein DinB